MMDLTQVEAAEEASQPQERASRPLSRTLAAALVSLSDLCVVDLAGIAIFYAYVDDFPAPPWPIYIGALTAGGGLAVALLHWIGAYGDKALFGGRMALGRIVGGWAIAFSLLLALAFALKITSDYSRVWATSWFFVVASGLLLSHATARWRLQTLARRGRFAARTAILGAGEHGRRLARHLARHGDADTKLLGFIDDRAARTPTAIDALPLLGNSDDLLALVRDDRIDQVFVALPWHAEERVGEIVRKLARTPVRIRLTPDLAGFQFMDRGFEQIARLPVLKLYDRPISGWSQVAKAAEDRVLSALLLLFLAPLLLLIAAAIKLDSPGPVFFRQMRQGFNNNLIRVWKFRTMYRDQADAHAAVQTTPDDPRVTPLGAFLRRSSLDELPQLFNVLLGDMSLVGPRPHALQTKAAGRIFEEVVDDYAARHNVKPGITGWAQINGWRGETDTVEKIENRVQHDLYYIENWSVWFDLEILLRTLFVVLNDRNAY